MTVTTFSARAKKVLQKLNNNITVIRHPDHEPVGGVFLWSHHEKIVCVDQSVAFLGGLDMCFERYDTHEHRLVDNGDDHMWPGKDYANTRFAAFSDMKDPFEDLLDRNKIPRQPWHDIACRVTGEAARDAGRHFIQRWNHEKREKSRERHRGKHSLLHPKLNFKIKKASVPSTQRAIEQTPAAGLATTSRSASARKPLATGASTTRHFGSVARRVKNSVRNWIARGRPPMEKQSEPVQAAEEELFTMQHPISKNEVRIPNPSAGNYNVQVLRSCAGWSMGLPLEASIYSAYLHLIEHAEHFIYIENQFFVSDTAGGGVKNRLAQAIVDRIRKAAAEKRTFRVFVILPLFPDFVGLIHTNAAASLRLQLDWEYQTICRAENSIFAQLSNDPLIDDPNEYISFCGLRNVGILNGKPVTEQIYVHSKLMIVDDRYVILGSANINDRSMMGGRDSEIAIIAEDMDRIASTMDGKEYEVGRNLQRFRISLFQEHMGIDVGDIDKIKDPVADSCYNGLWRLTAKSNTRIFRESFHCLPDNKVHTWEELDAFTATLPEPNMEQLKQLKGDLVKFPLKFLQEEDLGSLAPWLKENLLPAVAFH
eukprot:GILJ01024679.1.p2 GENE.GILJ01024679.1~~GILJ01024679.1.p2  ORF type:complete len:595 (-),score=81.98 GILJ01024679.1:153-1937(-)